MKLRMKQIRLAVLASACIAMMTTLISVRAQQFEAGKKTNSNQTTAGQDINQRVDVKVIVNKGIEEGAM